jgi:homocitrate synthase NifV
MLALGAKAGQGAVRNMLRQVGLEGPLNSIGSLVDTIRQRANSAGRPLSPVEVQDLAKVKGCLEGGIC